MRRVAFPVAYWRGMRAKPGERSGLSRRWPRWPALFGRCGILLLASITGVLADPLPAPQESPDAGPLPTSSDGQPISAATPSGIVTEAPQEAPEAGPLPTSYDVQSVPGNGTAPGGANSSQNSENNDNSSSSNSDNTGNNPAGLNTAGAGNSQTQDTPLLPSQALNSSPLYSSAAINGAAQSSPLSAPALFNTGVYDLSQISSNNALAQAFMLSGTVASEQSPDQGPSPLDRIRIGPVDLKTSLNLTAVSDDNINAQPSGRNRLSDTELTLVPAVLILYGTHEGQKGFASLVYAPTLSRFLHYSAQNSDNQNVSFSGSYPFQRFSLNASETYTQVTGVNLDSRARTTQTTNVAQVGGNYGIDDKFSVQSAATYYTSTYSGTASGAGSRGSSSGNNGNGGLQGDERESWATTLSYSLSDKVTFGPGVTVGLESPQGSPHESFEQGLMNVNYQPTEKIGLYAQGGAEWRQYSGGTSEINPVFSLGANYAPTENATIGLNASQSTEPTSDNSNQTDVNLGVSVFAAERLFQKLVVNLSFSYEHTEYQGNGGTNASFTTQTSGTGATTAGPFTINANGSNQDNFIYRPSLSYQINEWTSIALYYQYQANSSSVPGSAYYSNSTGLSLSGQF